MGKSPLNRLETELRVAQVDSLERPYFIRFIMILYIIILWRHHKS